MRKRYSNFHRARKYHRKFRNALYSGWGAGANWFSELQDKYENLALTKDSIKVDIRGIGDKAVLIIKSDSSLTLQEKDLIKHLFGKFNDVSGLDMSYI